MSEFSIDDPFDISALKSRALEESRRKRLEATQKRRAEAKLKREERERIRRVKEEWERESQLLQQGSQLLVGTTAQSTAAGSDDGNSDCSPDLMESPPPSPKFTVKKAAARRPLNSDSSDDNDKRVYDKSTTKKSNRRSKLDNNDFNNDHGRTEGTSILRKNYSKDSPKRSWQVDSDITKPDFNLLPDIKGTTVQSNNNAKKKPWQMDSSDDDEDVDFESLRKRREQNQSSSQAQRLQQTSHPTKPSVKFSPKLPTKKKKHKFAESSSSSEDEAALEERLRKRFEEKQRRLRNNSTQSRYSSSSGEVPSKFQQENNGKFNQRYSSSSGENAMPAKFEENKLNRYSSSSGECNNIPQRFQDKEEKTLPAAPSKQKRSRLTQAESSSEDEAELENQFRKSMEEKRLASYKRNPLSMAKKDDDDWKVRMHDNGPRLHVSGEGLVGKEIVVKDETVKETKEDVSELGSQEKPSRRVRRGLISSPASPSAAAKKQGNNNLVQDDLWDDSEGEEFKKAVDSDDGEKKKRGRKPAAKQKDENWHDSKQKKRSRPRPKKMNDDSTSPQPPKKRPSPSKKINDDSPIARKRRGRRVEIDKEESDASISDDEEERRMTNQLKPNFANPVLGPPGPLEPLALTNGDDDTKPTAQELENGVVKHQVPASINRYLQDYQRQGIQFMYSSVIQGKGCVLGDDMGLGKTVQVISLIAALQNKTGTGLDQVKIKRLRRDVAKAVKTATKAEFDKRLGMGTDVDIDRLYDKIERSEFAPILVICPSSVVQNWVNEFETWGHFNVSVYRGNNREREFDELHNGSNFILITGKNLLSRESDFANFASVEWKGIFVDEYHEFKNHKSQAYKCLKQISENDGVQIPTVGLTGTLMQNRHEELFTLIDLVRPGILEDMKSFMEYTSKPIMLARAKDAKENIKRIAKQREEELMRTLSPVFIERKKEVVLKDSLTEKIEKVIFCELSEVQKKLYRHLLSLPDYEMLRMGNAPCGGCNINQQYFISYKRLKTKKERINYQRRHKDELVPRKECCFQFPYIGLATQEPGDEIDPHAILWWQKHKTIIADPDALPDGSIIVQDLGDGYGLVSCKQCPKCIGLSAMSKLHKVCSHPSLLQVDRTAPQGAETNKKLEFAKVAFREDILAQLPGQDYYRSDGIMVDHLKLSGKMKTLDYCLKRYIRKQDRVLVFSYSTATLDLIQQHIKVSGWSHLRLDGQTPTTSRQSLVDKFQKDETISIFLISTRAGGLGLNLTAANKVIIFDVNWNPSYDEQAQDRAYRIGQENNVEVIRLVARGTIEEQMYARQVYKVQLKKQTLGGNADGTNQPQIFRGVDKDDKRKGELFGIENLLMFRDGSFMQLLWKKTDNPTEAHGVDEIARFTENDMNKAIEEDGMEDDSDISDSENDVAHKIKATRINHEDLFNAGRGRARCEEGDDGFEGEMGGQSQMVHVATTLALDLFDSDTGDEEVVENAKVTKLAPVLNPVIEVNDCSSPEKSPLATDAKQLSPGNNDTLPNRKGNTSFTGDSPPITQPSEVINHQAVSTTQKRSKVQIMGKIFDESKEKKTKSKKSGLYIPSYSKSKRAEK